MRYSQRHWYVNQNARRGRIRSLLAGLFLGVAIVLTVVYVMDGPVYTTSEIDGILAASLQAGE